MKVWESDIKNALAACLQHRDLTVAEMSTVMEHIMRGEATPAQIGGLLVALRMKGESVSEITAAVQVMRRLAKPVHYPHQALVDIVGTGGDGAKTFNISTAASFVVAAAGACVAKHGNRSVSSACGSADVLEAAGAKLDLTPEQTALCVAHLHIGFMFAPAHHHAMKFVSEARKQLGARTLFNLLGPLTNPANAKHHLIGVYEEKWLMPFAEVLRHLGSKHALIVHAEDGLDEFSIAAPTQVVELKDSSITAYTVHPEELLQLSDPRLDALKVENAQQSLRLIQSVFDNTPGPARDIVLLNAGAALYAADCSADLKTGVALAEKTLASGKAKATFTAYIHFTQQLIHSE